LNCENQRNKRKFRPLSCQTHLHFFSPEKLALSGAVEAMNSLLAVLTTLIAVTNAFHIPFIDSHQTARTLAKKGDYDEGNLEEKEKCEYMLFCGVIFLREV